MAAKEYDYNDRISVLGDYYDFNSSYNKQFLINFYPSDNSLDIFDLNLKRMFLKRMKNDDVEFKDFFIGNTLRIYGRQIKLTDYANNATKNILGKNMECTMVVLKPGVINKTGDIINIIQENGFIISKMKMCILSRKEALLLYDKRRHYHDLPFFLDNVVSGPVIAMELVGENAIKKFLTLMGPRDPVHARRVSPKSLRALYGRNTRATSGFHGAAKLEDVEDERKFFFPDDPNKAPNSPIYLENATCCVIKPHAIREGNLGNIIKFITNDNFILTAAQISYLSTDNANVFLEVYKGVVADYNALLHSFVDGPCVALAIAGKNEGQLVQKEFKEFCGPSDPVVARLIRPHTLRANFGCDKYKNAVHCTDLEDDTNLELEFLFKVL